MFLANSSQRQGQMNKAHLHKIVKDIAKVCGLVLGLKVASNILMKSEI